MPPSVMLATVTDRVMLPPTYAVVLDWGWVVILGVWASVVLGSLSLPVLGVPVYVHCANKVISAVTLVIVAPAVKAVPVPFANMFQPVKLWFALVNVLVGIVKLLPFATVWLGIVPVPLLALNVIVRGIGSKLAVMVTALFGITKVAPSACVGLVMVTPVDVDVQLRNLCPVGGVLAVRVMVCPCVPVVTVAPAWLAVPPFTVIAWGVGCSFSMVIESAWVSKFATFSALTVKLDVPSAVGVPDITPALESVKPLGKLPLVIVHVMGVVPVACNVWL